jgi:predicted dehydrogenase
MTGGESTPVRVGFIGAGSVLPAYLQTLDRLVPRGLAEQGPVCARRRDTWAGLRARRPSLPLVDSIEEVLEDAEVTLVVLLTPPGSHAALARAALDAGKNVLCEKPLAGDAGEAAALFERAASAERLLMAAPFVHLSPSFRQLWALVQDGALGPVHSARAHYGNVGSESADWYFRAPAATLGDAAIYNLKSLAALLGPVTEVTAAAATAVPRREVAERTVEAIDPDTWQLVLRHEGGALSSVLASHATPGYRRPAVELYGSSGTANLTGDDWDPRGIELLRAGSSSWELIEPDDVTWLWTDGLREAVMALRAGRPPLHEPALDVHLHEVISAAVRAASDRRAVTVVSRFPDLDALRPQALATGHVHDRTRPADEQ